MKQRSRAIPFLTCSAMAILLCALLYAAMLAAPSTQDGRGALLRLAGMLASQAAVAVAAAWVSRRTGTAALRRAWLLFALAALTAALGFLAQWVGWPVVAGALLFLRYLLYFAGLLLCMPAPRKGFSRLELALDVALAILIVGMGLAYVFWLPELLTFDSVVAWFYALGDALLLSVCFGLLARSGEPLTRLPTAALATGFGLATVADLCHARMLHSGLPGCPPWIEAAWLLGQGCLVWAALATLQLPELQAMAAERLARMERRLDIASVCLRVLIIVSVCAVLVRDLDWLALQAHSTQLLAGALLLLSILTARYAVLRLKNERLTSELRAAASRLRQRVDERTHELAERITEVQLLRAEAERRASEQAALNSISTLVNSSLHVNGVLDAVMRQAAELFHADGAALYTYDEARDALEMGAHHMPLLDAQQLSRWQHIPLTQSPSSADLLHARRPLLIPDASTDHRMPPAFADLGMSSALFLPLLVQERLLGLVVMNSQRADGFSEHDVELAMAMGQHVSIAMENARLYEELSNSMEELQRAQMDLLRSQRLEALAQTVAGAAHELNNPLTVVQGYSELLLRQNISPQMRGDIERILQAIERSRQVVSALLAFGQREAILRRPVDINQVLERTLSLCQFDLEAAQIRVERRMEPGLPLLCGDAALLRQAFFNIIINARQAMSEAHRGGRLTVRSFLQQDKLRVEISDDGPGIAPEIMDKIFDPFFTTRPPGQGMGLGLSLGFGIFSEHGGRIWALSPAIQQYADGVGPGATLVVELPPATPEELARD